MRHQKRSTYSYSPARRRYFSPLALIGALVPVVLLAIAGAVFVLPHLSSRAAAAPAVNGDCTLIVPANPLTATGLATPYQLMATNPKQGPCHEVNNAQAAFVQGAVIDPATGQISIYNPLVIDKGTKPAIAPTAPVLPTGGVVALWFGSNGNNLLLRSTNGSIQQGNCANGPRGSIFGQFSYCNAPAFFQAANTAIQSGKLKVPALGTAKDNLTCPTTRDFSIIDQDQSDNVTTSYIITANGELAQDTQINAARLNGSGVLQKNGSDEGLITLVDSAIGCTPWTAPDLANKGSMIPALPLNEIQAAMNQTAPVALVPAGDPMVLVNNNASLNKINLYRMGVDQQLAQSLQDANTRAYCANLLAVAPSRLQLDAAMTKAAASPNLALANSLYTFLAQRFVTTFGKGGLNCMKLLGKQDPVTLKVNKAGVTIGATINVNGKKG